jgi:hypothetical protein
MEKVKSKKDFDSWKKKVQPKQNFDIRKLAGSERAEKTSRFEETASTSKDEPYVEPAPVYGGLGAWVPIIKEAPRTTELQIQDQK